MPLGAEVGPGDIVLDGDPPTQKGATPNFRLMCIVAKRLYISGFHLVWRSTELKPKYKFSMKT